MSTRSGVVAALAAVAVTLAACGGSGGNGGAEPPTPEALAEALVVPEDLQGTWITDEAFAEWPDGQPGVIPEDQMGMMPTIEFCDDAGDAAKAAASDLTWQAFTHLNMDLPQVSGGAGKSGNMVAVQEALLAGDEADIEATFTALRDGVTACFGGPTDMAEGTYTSTELDIGDLGDDRIGAHDVLVQTAGDTEAAWTNTTALVRKGAVIMSVNVMDLVVGADTQPALTEEDIQAILTTAASKLP